MHHLPYKPESGIVKLLWFTAIGGQVFLISNLSLLLLKNEPEFALGEFTQARNIVYFGCVVLFVGLGLWHSLKGTGRKKKEQARYYSSFSSLIALVGTTLLLTTFSYQIATLITNYIKQLGVF